ncbi:MAG: hypothetical protein ACYTA3_10570, partial [Planctomycetota bacterium]
MNLSSELGLTDAEQAVMQSSVLEKIEAEKRAAEAKETEAAERKAAAERAKKAAEEAAVEEEVAPEPTVEELMPELTKAELAKLLKERPNLRLAYFGKDGRRDTEFTIGYNRATGKYFFSDNNRIYRGSDYDKFSQALKRLLYQKRRGMVSGDFIGLYDNLMNSEPVLAKFDFEMN